MEHFLSALEHQASSRGVSGRRSDQVMSQSIWSMLRMTLASIGRADLYAAVDSRWAHPGHTEPLMRRHCHWD